MDTNTKTGPRENITIIVPTMNRPMFVKRLLDFLSICGYGGHICIGDSSNPENRAEVENILESRKDKLNIIHRYYDQKEFINDSWCIADMVHLAPTKYGVFCGDDDLLLPSALARCVRFLEENEEYAAAHGYRIEWMLDGAKPHGPIRMVRFARELALDSGSALERWIEYMRYPISTQYYVHRIATWKDMYRYIRDTRLRYIGPELLPCSISTIAGKIKEINEVSTLFQVHDEHHFSWHKTNMYQLLLSDDWGRSATTFRDVVSRWIAEREGVPAANAQEIVDREFWRHLNSFLVEHFSGNYPDQTSLAQKTYMIIAPMYFRILSLLNQSDNRMHRATNLRKLAASPFFSEELGMALQFIRTGEGGR